MHKQVATQERAHEKTQPVPPETDWRSLSLSSPRSMARGGRMIVISAQRPSIILTRIPSGSGDFIRLCRAASGSRRQRDLNVSSSAALSTRSLRVWFQSVVVIESDGENVAGRSGEDHPVSAEPTHRALG